MPQKHIVKKLPRDPGPAAWNEILGPAPSYPIAEGDITADWLIIGGGFAGLSAAKRLSELRGGDKIIVIDACHIASGPAGRNSGFMIDLPHELGDDGYTSSEDIDRKQITLNRHAQDFAKANAAEFEMAPEAVAAVGRVNGAVNASGKKHNDDYADHLTKLGEDFTHLSSDDMESLTGSSFYSSGLFMPGAVMLQPALYIRELAKGLSDKQSRPITIYENSPAISYQKQGQNWLVETPHARIRAGAIIMAVNGHAESFGFYKNKLMHVFTYASMTDALTKTQMKKLGGSLSWGITPSDPMGSTVRRHDGIGGNRIVIRNRWTFDPEMAINDKRLAKFGKDHARSFRRRFPMLDDVSMAYRWSGRLCLSRNSVPAFGELETNWFSACCQNGLGTAKGTLAGIGAVDLATKANSPIVQDLLSYDEPVTLPPRPLSTIGANLVIKWRELKAGAEL